ncbi:carboxylesterase 4A-like [Argopecten irradians]|uniref:carboxylesterase 4A-like n=1 Tax=Argopecten irradians TaxID=31199 RepID=UPI0037201E99
MVFFLLGIVMLKTETQFGVMGQRQPLLHTRLGTMRGIVENGVKQYRSIPYAKPPIGPLRFAKSVAAVPWNGVRDASKFGPSCMQPPYPETDKFLPSLKQSEDCLFLNVYVPGNTTVGSNKHVMVWVHGGGFFVGQAMLYDGSFLASQGDVIVVTVNYRLGIFGFLSTMDSHLPGNYGLWDQRLALQWVQENIALFGGNPKSVTIFGESAGAISASLQSINPLNKGLFQRAIVQSGTAMMNAAIWKNAKTYARDAGVMLNCSTTTSKLDDYFVRCMRSLPLDNLLNVQNDLFIRDSLNFGRTFQAIMGPVIDNILIPDSPLKLLSNKSSPSFKFFLSLGFMAGNVNQEGSLFLPKLDIFSISKNFNVTAGVPTSDFCDYLVPMFTSTYTVATNRTIATQSVCSMYRKPYAASQANSVLDCYSDVNFIVPVIETLNIHSADNILTSTYQYMFNRQTIDKSSLESLPPWFIGAPHGSEVFFLFGAQVFQTKFNITVSSTDLALSHRMILHWSNFAKNGNPNIDNHPMWISYDIQQKYYMDFNQAVTIKTDLYKDRVSLWLGTTANSTAAWQSAIVGRET